MKLKFLELPEGERRLYLQEAAARRNLSPVILEKDFWVSWLLAILFESEFADHLVFKGGTSLSKVFGVIDRFSEDLDLSLAPEFLNLPAVGATRNQANKWMTEAEEACGTAVRDRVRPVLERTVEGVLGKGRRPWLEYVLDAHTNSPVLLFHYPSTEPAGFAYLIRAVKLEFGSLTEQRPAGHHPVRPWLADALPEAFHDWTCDVVALDVERTFWEKATILHAEYHRPPQKTTPDRFSRHYADTAALAEHPVAGKAVDRLDLLARVAGWKGKFFGSSWSHYEDAKPGTFRLVPPPEREVVLRRDYQAMRDMYITTPPSFDEILATLAAVERNINDQALGST